MPVYLTKRLLEEQLEEEIGQVPLEAGMLVFENERDMLMSLVNAMQNAMLEALERQKERSNNGNSLH